MHRAQGADETWVRETRVRVEQAADVYRQQAKDLQQRIIEGRSAEDRALASYQLAVMYNQLAWLLANTDGNADEAIKYSVRSLELMPDRAGFLDTLARCCYAKGDFAAAVQHQSRAIALEPHSPTMRAQLELFTTALREQAPESPPGAAEQGSR